jgi:hypothetical protein
MTSKSKKVILLDIKTAGSTYPSEMSGEKIDPRPTKCKVLTITLAQVPAPQALTGAVRPCAQANHFDQRPTQRSLYGPANLLYSTFRD